MICPNCKAEEKDLDWRVNDKNEMVWNCFECGNTWIEKLGDK